MYHDDNPGQQLVGLVEAFWQELLGALLNFLVGQVLSIFSGLFPQPEA